MHSFTAWLVSWALTLHGRIVQQAHKRRTPRLPLELPVEAYYLEAVVLHNEIASFNGSGSWQVEMTVPQKRCIRILCRSTIRHGQWRPRRKWTRNRICYFVFIYYTCISVLTMIGKSLCCCVLGLLSCCSCLWSELNQFWWLVHWDFHHHRQKCIEVGRLSCTRVILSCFPSVPWTRGRPHWLRHGGHPLTPRDNWSC